MKCSSWAWLKKRSLSAGFDESLIRKISALDKVRVLVVCGKNETYQKHLLNIFQQSRVTALGFYTPMAELYAVADIYVGKPGGLTTSEALSWDLPLLVTHWLPGQEELNIEYLQKRNLVMLAGDTVAQIKQEIESGEFKKQLQSNPHVSLLVKPEVRVKTVLLQVLHGFD